jgi:hypothetical protein
MLVFLPRHDRIFACCWTRENRGARAPVPNTEGMVEYDVLDARLSVKSFAASSCFCHVPSAGRFDVVGLVVL